VHAELSRELGSRQHAAGVEALLAGGESVGGAEALHDRCGEWLVLEGALASLVEDVGGFALGVVLE
jgi:hypothetical protein